MEPTTGHDAHRPRRVTLATAASSVLVHGAWVAVAWMAARSVPPRSDPPRPAPTEVAFDWLAAPREPQRVPAAVIPQSTPVPLAHTTTEVPSRAPQARAHAAATDSRRATTQSLQQPSTGAQAAQEPTSDGPPAPTATAPQPAAPPANTAISAAELYTHVDDMAANAARNEHIDLGSPTGHDPAARHLFGHPGAHSNEDVGVIALAPTRGALEGSRFRPLPPGGLAHDRALARRAAEEFDPVHTIPGLGAAVLRAPTTRLPPVHHENSAGENAVADEIANQHAAQNTGPVQVPMATVPPPPFHLVRVELELDQDDAGAVLDVRVVQASRVPGYDAAAMDALRRAPSRVRALATGGPRRSRWLFEVSDAHSDALSALLGAGNDGWQVLDSPSNGVELRARVRLTHWEPLPGARGADAGAGRVP